MRASRSVIAIAVVALMATAAPARGSTPASATISRQQRTVKWSGGPYYAPRPVGCHTPYLLLSDDPTCDYFHMRVKLGHGAKIWVRLVATRSAPVAPGPPPLSGDDYDIYVWSPQGGLIAEGSAAGGGREGVIFTHDAKYSNAPYEIEVIPFLVAPGSTYTATAKALSLGR